MWGYSLVGRAPALQAGGHEFESHYLHHTTENSEQRTEVGAENGSGEDSGAKSGLTSEIWKMICGNAP